MDPLGTPPETLIDTPTGWEGRTGRGFRLARVSWDVLSDDRRLVGGDDDGRAGAACARTRGLLLMRFSLYATGLNTLGLRAVAAAVVALVAVWVLSAAPAQVFALAVFQHATGGPCFDGFPSADLERPRDGSLLRLLRARKRDSPTRG